MGSGQEVVVGSAVRTQWPTGAPHDPTVASTCLRSAASTVLVLCSVAGAMSAFGCARTGNRAGLGATMRVERDRDADLPGHPNTILRIVCDIPDDVGLVARPYAARIDWPRGSEAFAFGLSKENIDVPLQSVIAPYETVRIFFTVDDEPLVPTRFGRGEWFYRGHLYHDVTASHPNTLRIPLSRFRDAHDFATMVAP